jgi:CheY-like chemotaxis protein
MRSLDCRVLVVDDDLSIRESLQDVLGAEGYAVDVAENGSDALFKMRRRGRPDVVLLDLMMPVMNGWQFLREVGHDDELTGLPVVVLSAKPEPAGLDGVFDVIAKPFTYERLLSAVERACA